MYDYITNVPFIVGSMFFGATFHFETPYELLLPGFIQCLLYLFAIIVNNDGDELPLINSFKNNGDYLVPSATLISYALGLYSLMGIVATFIGISCAAIAGFKRRGTVKNDWYYKLFPTIITIVILLLGLILTTNNYDMSLLTNGFWFALIVFAASALYSGIIVGLTYPNKEDIELKSDIEPIVESRSISRKITENYQIQLNLMRLEWKVDAWASGFLLFVILALIHAIYYLFVHALNDLWSLKIFMRTDTLGDFWALTVTSGTSAIIAFCVVGLYESYGSGEKSGIKDTIATVRAEVNGYSKLKSDVETPFSPQVDAPLFFPK